ncbi:hypothetical protein ESCOCP340M_04565 [Escherichia coli]
MRYDNVKPCPFCGCPSVTVKAFQDITERSVTDANPEPVMVEVKKKHSKDGINEPLEIIMEVFMYKITATIEKEGGTPTNWTRYSKSKLTKSECEKMLSGKKEAGVSREQKVKLINFNCEKLQSSRIALYSN